MSSNLLLINYSMSSSSMIFSHQRPVAISLASSFDETVVITSETISDLDLEGLEIQVLSSGWKEGQPVLGLLKFLKLALPLLTKNRKTITVFCHMTDVQACFIAPICWFLRIPIFLWYAHKSNSIYLSFSFPFLTGLLTSTSGSCPKKGEKVQYLGQGVSVDISDSLLLDAQNPPLRWYHIGRIDPSKEIETIIEAIVSARQKGWDLSLDFYGAPSSVEYNDYFGMLTKSYQFAVDEGWLKFHGKIQRSEIANIASRHDGFIHAYTGSLDKTLIEAALCRRLIATTNSEFHDQFSSESIPISLKDELLKLLTLSSSVQETIIESNYQTAMTRHTLEKWLNKLISILTKQRYL